MSEPIPVHDIADDRANLHRAFNKVFTGEIGSLVLEDLRTFCGVGYDAYSKGSFDQTAYSLGVQRVFLHIESRMNTDPRSARNLVSKEPEDE